jgi:hypothetical protein
MNIDKRIMWCIEQSEALERELPPRREWQPKTTAKVGAQWWRGMTELMKRGAS